MAVEKMKMMNLVSLKQDIHNILCELILDGSLHITNPSGTSNFTMSYKNSQEAAYTKLGIDINKISIYHGEKIFDKKKYKDMIDKLFDFFDIKEEDIIIEKLRTCDYMEKLSNIEDIYEKSYMIKNMEEGNKYARSKINALLNALEYFENSDMNISDLMSLEHINLDVGEISKGSWIKLKSNYENIKGLVIHLGSNSHGEKIMIFTPSIHEEDTIHLLHSLGFDRIELPNIAMSFKEFFIVKKKELLDLEKSQDEIKKEKEKLKKECAEELLALYYRYKIIEKIEEIESHMAQSGNFAMLSAFVPQSKIKDLENIIKNVSETAVVYFNDDDNIPSDFKIPTKLKNNPILRPFEMLVNMYSVPNYKEADPTPFFAITYMLLFGMMFGDVGQGAVFIIASHFLTKKIGQSAKILQRIGVSSIVFGFMYGSIFGIEDILPALLLRPMHDINTILIGTVAIGIIMIITAYFISFYNLKASRDIGSLYFDKNGISGFAFYISFILIVLNVFILKSYLSSNASSMLTIISVAIMIITSCLMFLKPKLVEKVDPYAHKEEFSAVESGFEMFETVMGFFSNTLSFIRVGAFAINHVGLFMAFHALGEMMGSTIGSLAMIILGNIVIIGLEGLIVFIQAIRLEYYELFSKYFKGEGISYKPIKVDIKTQA